MNVTIEVYKCPACCGPVEIPADEINTKCGYCGSNLRVKPGKVDSLVKFTPRHSGVVIGGGAVVNVVGDLVGGNVVRINGHAN